MADVHYALQTLHALHSHAKMAHLDLNSKNIMLSDDVGNPWSGVRLIDFGSSLLCAAGNSNHPNSHALLPAYSLLFIAPPAAV